MSTSPFMTPDQSRRRREASRRRRRRRRAAFAGVLAVVIVCALVVMALAKSHGAHGPAVAAAHSTGGHAGVAVKPKLSPSGLLLAKPPIALTGIATPQTDPRSEEHTSE